MNFLTCDSVRELAEVTSSPCLSIYQSTHRRSPENQQNLIRFRNLVRGLEESLLIRFPEDETGRFLEPFHELSRDADFWNHVLEGLAVFAAPGVFRVFRTQRPLGEMSIVAESFHTKPLRRFLQSSDRYQILALSRTSMRLFEGNRDVLDEIEPAPEVPRTLIEALGEELTEPHLTVASYGGTGPGSVLMRHGHGGKSEERDIDTERFFRMVDRAVTKYHSGPSRLPLILAALPQHHGEFRALSQNSQLTSEGIGINPNSQDLDQLRSSAWSIFQPLYHARLEEWGERFRNASSRQLASDELGEVASAAAIGRVETLLVEADRHLPGRLNPENGWVERGDLRAPDVDDLLDDLCALAEGKGGEVLVVPADFMPTGTGLAAIFRYGSVGIHP